MLLCLSANVQETFLIFHLKKVFSTIIKLSCKFALRIRAIYSLHTISCSVSISCLNFLSVKHTAKLNNNIVMLSRLPSTYYKITTYVTLYYSAGLFMLERMMVHCLTLSNCKGVLHVYLVSGSIWLKSHKNIVVR